MGESGLEMASEKEPKVMKTEKGGMSWLGKQGKGGQGFTIPWRISRILGEGGQCRQRASSGQALRSILLGKHDFACPVS